MAHKRCPVSTQQTYVVYPVLGTILTVEASVVIHILPLLAFNMCHWGKKNILMLLRVFSKRCFSILGNILSLEDSAIINFSIILDISNVEFNYMHNG